MGTPLGPKYIPYTYMDGPFGYMGKGARRLGSFVGFIGLTEEAPIFSRSALGFSQV